MPQPAVVRAVSIDTSFTAVPRLKRYTFDQGAMLAIDKSGTPVVNTAYFGDLHLVRATYIGPGTKPLIGNFKNVKSLGTMARDVALFLVESQIIQTYLHIESHLCLASEENTDALYRAHFTGTHIYYTNKRNEDPIQFDVLIDKKTGAIQIGNS